LSFIRIIAQIRAKKNTRRLEKIPPTCSSSIRFAARNQESGGTESKAGRGTKPPYVFPVFAETTERGDFMLDELPLGFSMALAKNPQAMERFSALSEQEQKQWLEQTHQVRSSREMQQLVQGLADSSVQG